MSGRWFDNKEKEDFENSVKNKFIVREEISSTRSISSREREYNPINLVKRVRYQIEEMNKLGIDWSTPEGWDKGFYEAGLGSLGRTSSVILSRMSWGEFLNLLSKSGLTSEN